VARAANEETGKTGQPRATASPKAAATPTRRDVNEPGPTVTAMASRWSMPSSKAAKAGINKASEPFTARTDHSRSTGPTSAAPMSGVAVSMASTVGPLIQRSSG
jgi:hypothetical protein